MQQTKSELFDVFDFADLSFFYLIAKKNIKFLIITSFTCIIRFKNALSAIIVEKNLF